VQIPVVEKRFAARARCEANDLGGPPLGGASQLDKRGVYPTAETRGPAQIERGPSLAFRQSKEAGAARLDG